MQEAPRLSGKERLILELLHSLGESAGLQLVKASDGKLKRGTVYVTLDRMADKGLVDSREIKDGDPLPKRLFFSTHDGMRALVAWQAAEASWAAAGA